MARPKRKGGQTQSLSGRVSPETIQVIREEAARLGISQSNYVEMCVINAKREATYYLDVCPSCGYSEPWDEAEFLATRYHLDDSGLCPECKQEWPIRSDL